MNLVIRKDGRQINLGAKARVKLQVWNLPSMLNISKGWQNPKDSFKLLGVYTDSLLCIQSTF